MRPRRTVRAARRKAVRRNRASRTRPTTTKRNPFTGLLVTGIRSLVAALPFSKFLTPLTDICLSSIGLSSTASTEVKGITSIDGTAIYGLCGLVMVKYANILARTSNAALDTTKGARPWVNTPYTDARLVNLTITLSPDTQRQSRSGRWGLLLLPFRDDKDESEIQNNYSPLPLSQLERMAGCVSGPADRPLQLRFTPTPSDGFCFNFHSIDTFFAAVVIAHSENVRDTYHQFLASDFAPDLSIRGQIRLRQPHFGSPVTGFEDKTWSPNYPAYVYDNKSKRPLKFTDTPSFACNKSEKITGTCTVSGHAKTVATLEGFEAMAL